MTEAQQEYAAFIDRLGLRHFSGKEFALYADRTRGGVKNGVPPEGLWTNIIPTLLVIDEIRERAGSPVTITSAYRSPAYNRAVGGESASFHMRNVAVDIQCATLSASALWKIAVGLRGKKFKLPGNGGDFLFKGGIGKYPSFVHVDTRGYNANW
jgi:hypothetical protein